MRTDSGARESMQCVVYRSGCRPGYYLFVREGDALEELPQALLHAMGALEKVMELELNAQRRLARVDAAEVMRRIAEQGYYLQMPPRSAADPDSS